VRGDETGYAVPGWVRVRAESFGLLFYDTRSTRLTYVRSGDDLVAPPFAGGRRALAFALGARARRPALCRLLEDLAEKGLLVVAAE
jgi:putative mycofactocin binding protein MftB